MIGNILAKARKDKGITKTKLSEMTDINIGHLTHIEKGERNPSHKTLKNICKALDIPYQPLMFTYDKTINEEQKSYDIINRLSYNKIVAIDKIDDFIDCPTTFSNASFALKIPDKSMEPIFIEGSYVFVELNTPLSTREYGLFSYNDKILIRKFYSKNGKITLKTENKDYEEIKINEKDKFFIIGKILKNK